MGYRSPRQKASILLQQLYRVCLLKIQNNEAPRHRDMLFVLAHVLSMANPGKIIKFKQIKKADGGNHLLPINTPNFWEGLTVDSLAEAARRSGFTAHKNSVESIFESVSDYRNKGGKPLTTNFIGEFLKISAEERLLAKAYNIPAYDETSEQAAERVREKAAVRMRKNRKDKGAKPREESFSRTKPWEALGMSRRTWERKRANGQVQDVANSCEAISIIIGSERNCVTTGADKEDSFNNNNLNDTVTMYSKRFGNFIEYPKEFLKFLEIENDDDW
jgi:hypothetical protein